MQIAFWQICVTFCGKSDPDEGRIYCKAGDAGPEWIYRHTLRGFGIRAIPKKPFAAGGRADGADFGIMGCGAVRAS